MRFVIILIKFLGLRMYTN